MLEGCIGYCGKLPEGFSYNPSLDFKKTFHFLRNNIAPITILGVVIGVLGIAYSSLKELNISCMEVKLSSLSVTRSLNAINHNLNPIDNPLLDITRDLSFQDLQKNTKLSKFELLDILNEYSELSDIQLHTQKYGDRIAYEEAQRKLDDLVIPLVKKNSIIF